MLDQNIYDKKYSQVSLSENDWLIARGKLAELVVKELTISSNDHVLDIGCDDGYMQRQVAQRAKEVVGIDINTDALVSVDGIKMLVMDATKMSFESSSFDKVYSSHTIEHIKDLESVFKEVDRVLKPEGSALFIYPWELWRGMAHARGAWKILHNPFLGYKFHMHRLNPKKVVEFSHDTSLVHVKSELVFMRMPQWVSLFRKMS